MSTIADQPNATPLKAMPRVEWVRCIPFVLMHLVCLTVFLVGWSPVALMVTLAAFFVRVFALTGFYHRYFSHRAFKTSRWFQFVGAAVGAASVQRGPLWWAAHHRVHHRFSDEPQDPHSPVTYGFFWSHMAWFMTEEHVGTREDLVKDWTKFPELRFLDRYELVVPVLFALSMFGLGVGLERWAPGMGTTGWQMLVWGFFVSTVMLYHSTFAINSVAHRWGSRPYDTDDESRNNLLLALLTFGEGWHNNHHYFPVSARQGFRWYQIDITYYILVALASVGLVWDLKPIPDYLRKGLPRPTREQVPAGSAN